MDTKLFDENAMIEEQIHFCCDNLKDAIDSKSLYFDESGFLFCKDCDFMVSFCPWCGEYTHSVIDE